MADADPLEDARALLAIARLVYRARRRAALNGVQPAEAAARAMVPIGRRLALAVKAAGEARTVFESAPALEEVARAGEALLAALDERWEGLGPVIAEAIAGVQGDVPRPPVR